MATYGSHNGITVNTVTTTLSNPSEAKDTWKYAVEAYTFGSDSIADETGDENPTVGEFADHLLTFRERDGECVISCPKCARRVEVEGDHTPAQRRAVGMYAIGHFLDYDCKAVDKDEIEDFYLGKPASSTVLNSLKHDLFELLVGEAEVLRHEDV